MIHPPRPLPAFAPVARQQLRFLLTSAGRTWWLMIPPVGTLVFFSAFSGTHPDSRFFVSLLLAMFLAILAWPQQKTAGGVAYFRSLPPPHWKNAAMRTGVVWAALMALCLASFLFIESGYPGAVPFWISGPALVAGTFALLVLSAAFAATRYPGFWLIGVAWIPIVGRRLEGSDVGEALEPLLTGRFGALAAMTGRLQSPLLDGSGSVLMVDPGTWLIASALWLAAGLAIFLFATSRRREY